MPAPAFCPRRAANAPIGYPAKLAPSTELVGLPTSCRKLEVYRGGVAGEKGLDTVPEESAPPSREVVLLLISSDEREWRPMLVCAYDAVVQYVQMCDVFCEHEKGGDIR